MYRQVLKVVEEVKVFHRIILVCGHKSSHPIPKGRGVRKSYFCHTCASKIDRETRRRNDGESPIP